MKYIIHIALFFSLAVMGSCTKKYADTPEIYGLDYYPLQTGKFVVYEADSTVYTDLPKDTINYRFLVKEKIADSYTDSRGMKAIRLERYVKSWQAGTSYDSMPWRMKEVWLLDADRQRIELSEGNIRYIRLIFPVSEFATWNGNAANTLGEADYSYDYIDRTEKVGGVQLEKVLMVKQKDLRTLISLERAWEKYAAGVGLVHRETTSLFSNNIVPGVPVEKRVEIGYIYRQILLSYGYE